MLQTIQYGMFRSYFKIALRNSFRPGKGRSPFYAWINISGLTIGLTAFLLIGHYIGSELRYDRFIPNHKSIYRLAVERIENGEVTMHSAKTYAGAGDILKQEIPEVEQYVRILDEECMFRDESRETTINRQRTFWADGNFPDFFGLKMLVTGQPEMLYQPNNAIISRKAAERFFGTDWSGEHNPAGKTLYLNEHIPFKIQGVFENLPVYSHMNVDFVVSYSTLMVLVGDFINTVMPPGRNFVYNYLAVKEGTNVAHLEKLINKVLAAHTGELADPAAYNFSMLPLTSIHLNSHLSDELNPNGNRLFVLALVLAALLIITVAWINFINLTISRALVRSKEVGVRKALGARKRQLAAQFATEIFFSGVLAMIISLVLTVAGSNYFNRLTGITTPFFEAQNRPLWGIFFITFLAGSALASIYPALVMSSFKTVKALKGKNSISSRNTSLRQGFITFQFFTALFLVSITGAVYYQVGSMQRQDLGVSMDRVLVVHSPRSMIGNPERAQLFEHFREKLEAQSEIKHVASGGCLPGEKFLFHSENIEAVGKDINVNWSFDMASVDENYLPALGIKLLGGRNFEKRVDETNKVLLNETAIRVLGFNSPEEATGQFIRINRDTPRQIIGVMADAHFEGLHKPIKPLLLLYGHNYEFGFFPVKLGAGSPGNMLAAIEAQWNESYPRDPFDYFYLDRFFNRQYKNDRAFGNIFGVFSLLTIFIAGLGLFGLMSYTTFQKSKEIVMRKILGANVKSIVTLLTLVYLKLILLAALLALPLAHWIIGRWLGTFAYPFRPEFWMYLLPLALITLTSLVSISGQTLKAALSNPVDSIADE